MKILNIRDLANVQVTKKGTWDTFDAKMNKAVARLAEQGICFGRDGRAYVPESRRGAGVGYQRFGTRRARPV